MHIRHQIVEFHALVIGFEMDIIVGVPESMGNFALRQNGDVIEFAQYFRDSSFVWHMPQADFFLKFDQDQPVNVTLQCTATSQYLGVGSRVKIAGDTGSYFFAGPSAASVTLSMTRSAAGSDTHMPMVLQTTSGSDLLWGGCNLQEAVNMLWEKAGISSGLSPGFNISLIARVANMT